MRYQAFLANLRSYVFGAATAIFFVNTYHGVLTGKYRTKAKIPYPTCYASTELADKDPAAFQFNCGAYLYRSIMLTALYYVS